MSQPRPLVLRYTHVMDIPPQYGPGYSVGEADAYAKVSTYLGKICFTSRLMCRNQSACIGVNP